jgi:hypothetical protein
MNVQEMEERDFEMGRATELQNAYAFSVMVRRPDDSVKIRELVAVGRYVVVADVLEYCPLTDASMGSRRVLVGDFATYDEALEECSKHDDDEVYVTIVPPQVDVVHEVVVAERVASDEIPF